MHLHSGVRQLELPFYSVGIDLYGMQGDIVQFCQKHRLSTEVQFNLTVILEEVYQMIRPALASGVHFSASIEYSEKKRITQFLITMPEDYEGRLLSLVDDARGDPVGDLAVTLVSGMVMTTDLDVGASEKRLILGLGQS